MPVIVDGTAGITFPQGATQIVGAGPAFSAYANTTPSFTAGTMTKVPYSVEEFDTNSNFDTTTYRFTPTVAGYYQINAAVQITQSSGSLILTIYKNGAQYKLGNFGAVAASQITIVSSLVYLNGSTDYVEAYAQPSGTGTLVAGSGVTYFNGCLMRGA